MKACIVNLPWETATREGIRAGCRFPNITIKNTNRYVPFPFLVSYTAAYLESKGVDVLLIDACAERCDLESFLQRIEAFEPSLLVAETSTTSFAYDLDVLASLRSRIPALKIAVYGSHTDARPLDALAADGPIDFVIQGEPEITSHELCLALDAGESVGAMVGVVSRDGSGGHHVNPRRPVMPSLDALPLARREGLPMDRYNVPGFPTPVAFLHGSRGCPYQCTFCLWPQTTLKGVFRARSPKSVVDEMFYILKRYPETKSFFFDEDTFNIGPRARLLAFADEMEARGLRIPWGCNARADNWDREVLTRLREVGLFTLRIGIESGDQGVLDTIKKNLDLDEARRNLHLINELGIENHIMFVIGLPGETEESVSNTIAFIKSVPCHSVQFSVATPFPGTEFYRQAEEKGHLASDDWAKYSGFDHVVVRTDAMTADQIGEALVRARRQIYFSPRFIARRLGYIRDVKDVKALGRKALRLLTNGAYDR